MLSKSAIRAGAAALAAFLAASAPAAAQQCASGLEVRVVQDTLIQAYALARRGAGGDEIAVNDQTGGVGLGRQTLEWLFERQCVLLEIGGDTAVANAAGVLEFSLIQHQEADCMAFQRVADANDGRRNALTVIDRDVSAAARGSYWDASLGQLRNISSDYCLGQ